MKKTTKNVLKSIFRASSVTLSILSSAGMAVIATAYYALGLNQSWFLLDIIRIPIIAILGIIFVVVAAIFFFSSLSCVLMFISKRIEKKNLEKKPPLMLVDKQNTVIEEIEQLPEIREPLSSRILFASGISFLAVAVFIVLCILL